MKKKYSFLIALICIVGVIILAGCTTSNRPAPKRVTPTPAPSQTRYVPRPSNPVPVPGPAARVPNPNTTRTIPAPGSTNRLPATPDTANRIVPGQTVGRPTPSPTTRVPEPGTMNVTDDRVRSKKITDRVAAMKEVKSATSVVTGNIAVIGVSFNNDYRGRLTTNLKDKIRKQVISLDNSIRRVVVTDIPTHYSKIKAMETSITNGKSVPDLTKRLDAIVRGINNGKNQ